MPLIGWLFIGFAAALVLGSLLMLRDSANMPISRKRMEKIRQRQEELDAQEKAEKDRQAAKEREEGRD